MLQLPECDGCVPPHLVPPLEIKGTMPGRQFETSYKADWNSAHCANALMTTSMYEAAGSALWLDPGLSVEHESGTSDISGALKLGKHSSTTCPGTWSPSLRSSSSAWRPPLERAPVSASCGPW